VTGEPVIKTRQRRETAGAGPGVLGDQQGSYGSCMSTDDGFFFVPRAFVRQRWSTRQARDEAFAEGSLGLPDSCSDTLTKVHPARGRVGQ